MVSQMMTQEFWLVLAARAMIGLLAAWVLGAVGFLAAFYVLFPGTPSLAILTPATVTMTALGCSVGAMVAWFRPDRSGWVIGMGVTILVAAQAGGWAGFWAGTPEATAQVIDIQTGQAIERGNPVTELITRPGLGATVLGGTLGANLAAITAYVLRVVQMARRQDRVGPAPA